MTRPNTVRETLRPVTSLGLATGTFDMFRVGSGFGHIFYGPGDNGYGIAAFAAMDIARASGLFATMAGPFAGRASGFRRSYPPDAFSRQPRGLMDQMTLDAAKKGAGRTIIRNLGDPRYKGMEKCSYSVRSTNGVLSEVHYVRDSATGNLFDFKFKHHAERYR